MKAATTLLMSALVAFCAVSCSFDPAKDTAKYLDKAFSSLDEGDAAAAGKQLDKLAGKLDGLDAAEQQAFFEAFWVYRENYQEGDYGSHVTFDNEMEEMLHAAEVPSVGTILTTLLEGAYSAKDEQGFKQVATLFEIMCYNGDHDRQLALRDKREAWFAAKRAEEEAAERTYVPSEEPAEEEPAQDAGISPAEYAHSVMEAFYKAAAAQDFDEYCGIDYECGEADWFTPEQWEAYSKAEAAWKQANPEKWAVIRAYRQALIADGNALSVLDLE